MVQQSSTLMPTRLCGCLCPSPRLLEQVLEIEDISQNTCSGSVVAGSSALDHQRGALVASAVNLDLITRQYAFVSS
jgi:hypothetical protein